MIVAGLLAPSKFRHDQPFDHPTATDTHNLDVYDITGTVGVNGGNPIAYTVTNSCFETAATTLADVILWHKTGVRGDDTVARFTAGIGGVPNGWFASLLIRAVGPSQTDHVFANFRAGQCYLGRRLSSSSSDWTSNLAAPAMNAGDTVELSAVGLVYTVVYETAAGVRTTVCSYNDSTETFVRQPGRRRHGMRIGYNGARSAWCDRWHFYDYGAATIGPSPNP